MKDVADKARSAKETVKEKAHSAKETIKDKAHSAKETIKDKAQSAKESVKESVSSAKESVQTAAPGAPRSSAVKTAIEDDASFFCYLDICNLFFSLILVAAPRHARNAAVAQRTLNLGESAK